MVDTTSVPLLSLLRALFGSSWSPPSNDQGIEDIAAPPPGSAQPTAQPAQDAAQPQPAAGVEVLQLKALPQHRRRRGSLDAPLTKTTSIYLASKVRLSFAPLRRFSILGLAGDGAATELIGGNSMIRLLPPITRMFVETVATLVSSCARDCVAPEAAYARGRLLVWTYGLPHRGALRPICAASWRREGG
jgi:hypothetical protein